MAEGFDFFLPVYNAAPPVTANYRKFRKVPCSTIRFPKKISNSKKIIVSRWRPKEFLTGRGHRRVRFFGARSGLATQGSNFYGRDSRLRQRVRNFRRAWAINRKSRKLPCSENRFPRQTFSSKNLIVGRPRPKTMLTAWEHPRVRFFGARTLCSLSRQRRESQRNARTWCFFFGDGV